MGFGILWTGGLEQRQRPRQYVGRIIGPLINLPYMTEIFLPLVIVVCFVLSTNHCDVAKVNFCMFPIRSRDSFYWT